MDEWQFSQPYSDGSSEAQRRYAQIFFSNGMLTAQTAAVRRFGSSVWRIAIFRIPHFSPSAATPYIYLTNPIHPTRFYCPPAFHSNFSLSASWDAAPFSWPAQFSQQPSETVYDPSVQPHWDDFVSSLQPVAARPPSTRSGAGDFCDGYGIDLLMADIGDEYSSSRFASAPPSSIPDDDAGGHPAVHVWSQARKPTCPARLLRRPTSVRRSLRIRWVKRYPEEFAERYKKDHRRYIEYLAQAEVDS
ncbi:hypothetical protein K438DRAFT_1979412 [Mycena galopus ATCC 62051]|nr:hypothetical protein K438DRAFT_1979412 [Mycena galopus ATCC 62051]